MKNEATRKKPGPKPMWTQPMMGTNPPPSSHRVPCGEL